MFANSAPNPGLAVTRIVVDFKTDQEIADELPRYRRQLSIYAKTIGEVHNGQSAAFLTRV